MGFETEDMMAHSKPGVGESCTYNKLRRVHVCII